MKKRPWQIFALVTTVFWGAWGAFIEIPEKAGFPATLGYSVWALTMIPCAIVALSIINWKLEYDTMSIFLGCLVGILGAGGQLILFQALRDGPAYIVFPVISLFPVVTIFLSSIFLKENTTKKHWVGISIALIAIVLLSYQESHDENVRGYLWLILSVFVFFMWGIQAYVMKVSNNRMKAESIFFYMTLSAVILIPIALFMTDFTQNINWGFEGPYLAALIQVFNSIGALTLVYAIRYGKAIIVVPMTALAPVITIILSLIIYAVFPHWVVLMGMILAVIAILLMAE
jgi:drug/metabolite transporter (DMT)-like permease